MLLSPVALFSTCSHSHVLLQLLTPPWRGPSSTVSGVDPFKCLMTSTHVLFHIVLVNTLGRGVLADILETIAHETAVSSSLCPRPTP